MMKYKICLLAWALVSSTLVEAQYNCEEVNPETVKRLETDISILASDKMGGRKPGTPGADMAAEYIMGRFKEARLTPILDDGYNQPFKVPTPVTFDSGTSLSVGDTPLKLYSDFYPTQHSANDSVSGKTLYVGYGITAPEKEHDDYAKIDEEEARGKIFVMDISSPDGIHPHSAYLKHHDLGERIKKAKSKGAIAVILINLEGSANDISPSFKSIKNSGIPVVFVTDSKWAKKLKRGKDATLTTTLTPNSVLAHNLVGFINNRAEHTIIIGAHYDHLGMGNDNSLYKGEPAIHNGADDNASGVAGLLELARILSQDKGRFSRSNYLFIAFSGEEMGLLGSSYFVENFGELSSLNPRYMINMDMIGRMEERMLAINGVGTSPAWEKIMSRVDCKALEIKTSASGVGPSDHTSFYYQEMPVLHFFTGTHTDYHKPTDDAHKVNFAGEAMIINYILSLIEVSAEFPEIPYAETNEQSAMAPRFSVTLGVMPDYMYNGEGMRIDGVTSGKPADKGGLEKGDVVTRLGQVKVVDMMSYMKALGQFKAGDKTEVEFERNGEKQTTTIRF